MDLKTFDNKLQKKFVSIVEIAFEFVDYNNEDVQELYVYGSMENDVYFFDTFYAINSKLVYTNHVNDFSKKKYDISDDRILSMQRAGREQLKEIKNLFKRDKRDIPTNLKIIYNAKTKAFNIDINYDIQFGSDLKRFEEDGLDEWYEEIKSQMPI